MTQSIQVGDTRICAGRVSKHWGVGLDGGDSEADDMIRVKERGPQQVMPREHGPRATSRQVPVPAA